MPERPYDGTMRWRWSATVKANGTKSWPTAPEFDLFRFLARVAPRAKLSDVSDALLEQGFVVDMVEPRSLHRATIRPDPEGPSHA